MSYKQVPRKQTNKQHENPRTRRNKQGESLCTHSTDTGQRKKPEQESRDSTASFRNMPSV
ncbi:hypothetical protein PAHAL_4G308500 [Panicum hallii]|uniref:Uncharacterized protein n=1 Tax=Panicum hallii TaxID=206008 RepID=A0A2T8JEK1_9POAL|nr:hypothetical protein PAHAL_4G308500 [Panicum hallii]